MVTRTDMEILESIWNFSKETKHEKGNLNGTCCEWHDNGKLKRLFKSHSGELHGMWTEYVQVYLGLRSYIKRFSHVRSTYLWKEFLKNGTINEGAFKNERDGTHRWWNRNGKTLKSQFFI